MKNSMSVKSSLFCLILLFGFFLSIATAQAKSGYPKQKNEYINDFAGVVNKADKKAILKLFANLEHKSDVEAVVVTIKSYKIYKTKDGNIAKFATNLFKKWGIGHKKKNGILLLLSIKERTCHIKLGRAYGSRLARKIKQISRSVFTRKLKKKKYSHALYTGAHKIVQRLTTKKSSRGPWFEDHKWEIFIGIFVFICILAGINCTKVGKNGWGWIFFTGVGILLLALLTPRRRRYGGGSYGSW